VAETRHGSGAWITLLLVMLLGVGLLGFQAVEVFGVSLILIGLFVFWGVRLFRGMNEDLLFASVILTEILTLYFIIVSAPTTFL
jgi:cobalamin synthase